MDDFNKNCCCGKIQNTFEMKPHKKLNPELRLELKRITKLLIKPKKGFLDLSKPVEKSDETRIELKFLNGFSDILSSDQLSDYVTGIIVNWSTAFSEISTGSWKLPKVMGQKRIITGVKIDQGTVPIFGTYNEMVTQGLDDLHDKCLMLKKNNCQFTTWKCLFKISDQWPSALASTANAQIAARYASVTQSTGMIPIIHLEIINLPKATYSIARAIEVHRQILSDFFSVFSQYHIALENIILMLAIIKPGIDNAAYYDPCTLANYTSTLLNQVLPPAIPAIVLSATNQQFLNH